jgi:hypothetical protein
MHRLFKYGLLLGTRVRGRRKCQNKYSEIAKKFLGNSSLQIGKVIINMKLIIIKIIIIKICRGITKIRNAFRIKTRAPDHTDSENCLKMFTMQSRPIR